MVTMTQRNPLSNGIYAWLIRRFYWICGRRLELLLSVFFN